MSTLNLLAWVENKLVTWQSDALRRIAEKGKLTDNDRLEVLTNLKRACSIMCDGEVICEPLQPSHLKPDIHEGKRALICSLADVEHVNMLASGQTLSFAIDGITLVYGDNGSGKSGYCRIVKKLCGARGVEEVLGNVFANGTGRPLAKATVRYAIEGEDVQNFFWQDGADVPNELSNILVFDSHHSRLYVDEKNKIEYLPYEIALLKELAQLFADLDNIITGEVSAVDARVGISLPGGYSVGTPAHEILQRLRPQTKMEDLPSIDEIEQASQWGNEQYKQLIALEKELATDPKVLAERFGRCAEALRTLASEVEAIQLALNDTAIAQIRDKLTRARDTKEAAKLAAAQLCNNEPLGHIGSEPWQLMYEHAKEYARLAYPNVDVLPTQLGDRCVLCQQELGEEARARLERFEIYVADRASQEAQSAENDLSELLKMIEGLQIRSTREVRRMLGEYSEVAESDTSLTETLVSFFACAGDRKSAVLERSKTGDFGTLSVFSVSPHFDCIKEAINLESAKAAFEVQVGEENERAVRRSLLRNLKDTKKLCEEKEFIISRRDDLEHRNRLTACRSALNTQRISLQVNNLRSELLTAQLKERILTEIEKLHINHIPFLVEEDSRRGESRYGVALDTNSRVENRHVLSEGEQKALALACFFAETRSVPGSIGILLDDPVSSLDQRRTRLVAERIVQEAETERQVIVFTHNLCFFNEVLACAAQKQIKVVTHCFRRLEKEGTGLILQDDSPWLVKKVGARIAHLRALLAGIGGQVDPQSEDYRKVVVDFYTDLRVTWERLVEEVLLGGVVMRFEEAVKTQKLKQVTVDDEDHQAVYWGMSKASEWVHDMAAGKAIPCPTTDKIKKDLDELEVYYGKIRKRSKEIQEKREALEHAPKAKMI